MKMLGLRESNISLKMRQVNGIIKIRPFLTLVNLD